MDGFRLLLHLSCVVLGYAGSFMFAICNVPAIMKIKKERSVDGVSLGWILLSTFANVCCGLFVLDSNLISGAWQYPLYGNYSAASGS